jgi:hypothetical protein
MRRYADPNTSDPLDSRDAKRMRSLLSTIVPLRTLFAWIDGGLSASDSADYSRSSPAELCRILSAISYPSPVSSFILRPHIMGTLLTEIGASRCLPLSDLNTMLTIQTNCPLLAALLQSQLCKGRDLLTFPVEMLPLISWLGDRCAALKSSMLLQCANLTAYYYGCRPSTGGAEAATCSARDSCRR